MIQDKELEVGQLVTIDMPHSATIVQCRVCKLSESGKKYHSIPMSIRSRIPKGCKLVFEKTIKQRPLI